MRAENASAIDRFYQPAYRRYSSGELGNCFTGASIVQLGDRPNQKAIALKELSH
ncbi:MULTISPECIES: hypothetical protein [unclassified Microcoleus]|uniref:hypothetical protein n=1 Tax=unclassified Microcoleus TaxID=2642155 RepID=UPI002FD6CD46